MRKMLLTRPIIESAKPEATVYRLWDTKIGGLHLRVWPSGVRAWYVQWGRNQARSLGRPPGVTLDMARSKALAVLNDAATNGTPAVAKPRPATRTLAAFLTNDYGPWARTHLKRGNEAVERIERVYAALLPLQLGEIDGRAVEAARTARREEGASAATCNRDLACLKAALARAVDWGQLELHPLSRVKPSKLDSTGVVRYLSDDEEAALRAALVARDRAMASSRESGNSWRAARGKPVLPVIDAYADHVTPLVLVAMNTGMRRGELTTLTWQDLDLPGKRLTVRAETAKAGKARHLPLNSEAAAVLGRWAQCTPYDGSRVFPIVSPKKAWAALMKDAKISNLRFHDLRHHFASRLVMAGIDLNTVRDLLGHADVKMTLRYAHLAPEHKAAAVEAIVRK